MWNKWEKYNDDDNNKTLPFSERENEREQEGERFGGFYQIEQFILISEILISMTISEIYDIYFWEFPFETVMKVMKTFWKF